MSCTCILSRSADFPADTPIVLVDDVIAAAWHIVDTLPHSHPLRVPLIHAVWALEDATDAGACLAAALPIVVGLVAVVSA